MSANIYAAQVKPLEKMDVPCWAPSSFISDVEKVFGEFPHTFSEHDIPKLEALAAICRDGGGNPWQDIIDKVETLGLVRVWAEN